jgi:hypothetical protein
VSGSWFILERRVEENTIQPGMTCFEFPPLPLSQIEHTVEIFSGGSGGTIMAKDSDSRLYHLSFDHCRVQYQSQGWSEFVGIESEVLRSIKQQ